MQGQRLPLRLAAESEAERVRWVDALETARAAAGAREGAVVTEVLQLGVEGGVARRAPRTLELADGRAPPLPCLSPRGAAMAPISPRGAAMAPRGAAGAARRGVGR